MQEERVHPAAEFNTKRQDYHQLCYDRLDIKWG